MTSEEIKVFAKEVYKQCVEREMTCEEFNLFVHYMTMHKEAANSVLHKQIKKLALPKFEDVS